MQQERVHGSNCMIYAGAGCDCGVAEELDQIEKLKAEVETLEKDKNAN